MAACVASLVLWFVEAPDSRFAWSYWWILAAITIAATVAAPPRRPVAAATLVGLAALAVAAGMFWRFDFSRAQRGAVVMVIVSVAVWATGLMFAAHRRRPRAVAWLCLALAVCPVVDRLGSHVLYRRAADLRSLVWIDARQLANEPGKPPDARQTRSGVTVYETLSSDYWTPLPSTPFFNPYLELRSPPGLGAGFRNANPLPYPRFGYRPRLGGSSPDED